MANKEKVIEDLKSHIWKTLMDIPNIQEHDIHLLISWLQNKKIKYHMENSHAYKRG